jgi:Holliday junction DNA helicase RuvA
MIGRLQGEVLECTPGEVLLDVAGVGYQLRVPLSTYYAIVSSQDRRAVLLVHTHVREDTLALFGFATPEERTAFERLLAIAGVGPRVALAVLSGIDTAELDRAVLEGDRARLERIPGIGRKTAERILLELRSRVARGREARNDSADASRRVGAAGVGGHDLREDALSALVNLGYSNDAAAKAVDAALAEAGDGVELQVVLRRALQRLLR